MMCRSWRPAGSRWVAGEAVYRLEPLTCPARMSRPGGPRPWCCSPTGPGGLVRDGEAAGPAVARLVARLDGMPLAIELAAARVEALGVAQLLRHSLALLAGGDRLAAGRHRSLAATVEWSYQLLAEAEQRVFRAVSVFPAPFTLEAAEVVAGQGAVPAVLRLVDCSLLSPRHGLERPAPVRDAGDAARLRGWAGEDAGAAAALAAGCGAGGRAGRGGLATSTGGAAASRWLDAEEATMRQVLAWALAHDPAVALRVLVALGWWWSAATPASTRWRRPPGTPSRAATDGAPQLGWAWSRCSQPICPGHWATSPRPATPCRPARPPTRRRPGQPVGSHVEYGPEQRGERAAARWPWPGNSATRRGDGPGGVGIAALYRGDYDEAVRLGPSWSSSTAAVPAVSRGGNTLLAVALIEAGDWPGPRTPARPRWPGAGTPATWGNCRSW